MTELQRLIVWAEAQVGTAEKSPGSNNVIYNTRYYGGQVAGDSYPWCCAFVWDGFRETGLSSLFVGGEKTAYCPFVMGWAQSHGQWVTSGYQAGDLPLFDWNGDGVADHIGICIGVAGSALTTIEGNVDNAVRRMTRSPVTVIGAFRPRWAEAPAKDPAPAPDRPRVYVVREGDTLSQIAERLGVDMVALARYNRISNVNLIYAGDVLEIPDGSETDTQPEPKPDADVAANLPVLADGSMGSAVQALQALLFLRGHGVGSCGIDGELGPETLAALRGFQTGAGLAVSGKTDKPTWEALIRGPRG